MNCSVVVFYSMLSIETVCYFQVINFSSAAIAAFIAMVGILSIIAQVKGYYCYCYCFLLLPVNCSLSLSQAK